MTGGLHPKFHRRALQDDAILRVNQADQTAGQASTTDWYIHLLSVSNPLRESVIRRAIQALQLPQGSRGLDTGCGIGLQALLLAEAVGLRGHVTGLDVSPEFLAHANRTIREAGLSDRVSFKQGSVNRLPFDDDTFDWAWSADYIGYPAPEPQPLIEELARAVTSGGTVAILVWSSQMLLPGYPLLEARLNATSQGIAPFNQRMRPASHHLRALGWLHDAGLKEPRAKAFVGSFYAPLSEDIRDALTALFQMRWGGAQSELSPEDRVAYHRLCQPGSPDFVLDLPDYYAFFNYSLFCGEVAK